MREVASVAGVLVFILWSILARQRRLGAPELRSTEQQGSDERKHERVSPWCRDRYWMRVLAKAQEDFSPVARGCRCRQKKADHDAELEGPVRPVDAVVRLAEVRHQGSPVA